MLRKIGKTAISVQAIGLGAMPLSIKERPDKERAFRTMLAAFEAGTNFFDTANAYCVDDSDTGHNERLIGEFLNEYKLRDKITVATKGGCVRPSGDWQTDGRPEALKSACDASLKALGVDRITLYQWHAVDSDVPLADSVGALKQLQEAGKVEHLGLSNVNVEQIGSAQAITRFESVQNRCHAFFTEDFENGVVDLCKQEGMTYIAHSPVGGHLGHKSVAIQESLQSIAGRYDCSTYCVMLAWLLAKGDHILPIPGASRPQSASDSPKALSLSLSAADIATIDGFN